MKRLTITSDAPGEKLFLMGNEAIARGAVEAGIQVATSYPGTPSTEITTALADIAKEAGIYVEWSVNEKVAFEVAFAASICGLRAMVSMKHVGLNVAHEPFMASGYVGAIGGLVVVSADDPGAWSSQNEQDNRFIARQAYIPILEPSSVQEAKDMVIDAFRLSEEFGQPFMLRTVTNIGHGRSDVVLGEISKQKRTAFFKKDTLRFGSGPVQARTNRRLMVQRMERIKKAVDGLAYNQLHLAPEAELGIIACGLSYSYTLESINWLGLQDRVSVLKIGTPYPLPVELSLKLLASVKKVLVVEELEPFVEDSIKALVGEHHIPVEIHGKDLVPLVGELSTGKVTAAIAELTHTPLPVDFKELDSISTEMASFLPVRPAGMCAGCPHRASLYAVKIASRKVAGDYGKDVEPIYTGDIGCYGTGGGQPPLQVRDTSFCMGSGFGIGNGMAHILNVPIVAYCGDSTFYHSGIPPLVNAVFNKANMTMIVLDNSATAMTGFEPNPGTGSTAMGDETVRLKPEDIARACGVKFVEVIDPFDLNKTIDVIEKAIRFDGPSFVVTRRVCAILAARQRKEQAEKTIPYQVSQERCTECVPGAPAKKFFMPCQIACPAGNDIPGFLNLAKQGKFQEGFELILDTSPLPAVLGRVCYHPCETDCNRRYFDESLAIQGIERFLGDFGANLTSEQEVRGKREKKVAIIGSGPAGLSCGYYLAKLGYPTTIYEALPVSGGMLAVGIPEYRLPKDVLKAEISRIEKLGVNIQTNTRVTAVDNLLEQGYKAVFIATGAHISMNLGVAGEEKKGVFPALSFLRDVNLGHPVAIGDTVIVVGGGNVAIDAARAAARHGAKQVSILYRRSSSEMPASDGEIEAVKEEGIGISYLVAPIEVLGNGDVTGLKCTRMKLAEPDETGRPRPVPIEGSDFIVECDTVIVAVGQKPDLSFANGKLDISSQGTLMVDTNTFATGRPGIFAGGDVSTGPAMVVDAVSAGRKAAQSIDRYLRGETLEEIEAEKPVINYEELNLACVPTLPRVEASKLPAHDRMKGFTEVECGLSPEEVVTEALRCFSCGPGAEKCITLIGCPALNRDDGRTIIDTAVCDGCSVCAQLCPYNAIVPESSK